jgi:hypothetical protein
LNELLLRLWLTMVPRLRRVLRMGMLMLILILMLRILRVLLLAGERRLPLRQRACVAHDGRNFIRRVSCLEKSERERKGTRCSVRVA